MCLFASRAGVGYAKSRGFDQTSHSRMLENNLQKPLIYEQRRPMFHLSWNGRSSSAHQGVPSGGGNVIARV